MPTDDADKFWLEYPAWVSGGGIWYVLAAVAAVAGVVLALTVDLPWEK